MELYMGMEAANIYGVKGTTIAKNGYTMRTGAGIRQQMKDGWIKYSSTAPTVNQYKDYLLDIYFSRTSEADRETTMITGTIGAIEFHDALAAVANGFLQVDTHFVRSSDNAASATPGLAYGAQYVRYTGPAGIIINVGQTPMYDDRTYCKQSHPQYANRPIDSSRKTFLEFGMVNGAPNIQMLKQKDTFTWGYHSGTYSPMGPVQGGSVSNLKAGYDVFCTGTSGIKITDVSRTGEWIMDAE